jgi:hypothetical protein
MVITPLAVQSWTVSQEKMAEPLTGSPEEKEKSNEGISLRVARSRL